MLAYSPVRGPERLLLATMAAVADERGERARPLDRAAVRGGRHRGQDLPARARRRCSRRASSSWSAASAAAGTRTCGRCAIRARSATRSPAASPRRVAPPAGARPLVASAGFARVAAQVQESATTTGGKGGQDRTLTAGNSPILTGVSGSKGGHDRTVSPEKCPVVTGVSVRKGRSGSDTFRAGAARKPGTNPGENPGRNPGTQRARGKGTPEPQNQGRPPQPP